jgi:hypothetical protein
MQQQFQHRSCEGSQRGHLLLDSNLLTENRDKSYLGRPEASGDSEPLQY